MGTLPWTIAPCPPAELRRLRDELGVSATLAAVLVRRGYDDPDEARTFLEGALPGHDPLALGDMAGAVALIRAAVLEFGPTETLPPVGAISSRFRLARIFRR